MIICNVGHGLVYAPYLLLIGSSIIPRCLPAARPVCRGMMSIARIVEANGICLGAPREQEGDPIVGLRGQVTLGRYSTPV
jgi:hypothetical protein